VSPDSSFVHATAEYERWRASRIPVVEDDLAAKHEKMTQSPFVLLRGTYYRFLQQFPAIVPEAAEAPKAIAVGDLHIENYGTWRDASSRLGWGINDFDEIDIQPYTLDLVRLATSALMAISEDHLALRPADACAAILRGWQDRIEHGLPTTFILGDRHGHLLKLASETFETPLRFARSIEKLPAFDGKLPKPAAKLLAQVAPWGGFDAALRTRVAGVGSLGSRRIVIAGELGGGLLVREAKQIPGPASMWVSPKGERPRGLADLVADSRGPSADPWRRQSAKWVLRPLAPDASRLELAAIKHKHDEGAYLHDMGAEAANVHLVSHSQAASVKALRKDAARRPEGWLHGAAGKMAELTIRDHQEWIASRAEPSLTAHGQTFNTGTATAHKA
jgi:hypothetical protein